MRAVNGVGDGDLEFVEVERLLDEVERAERATISW